MKQTLLSASIFCVIAGGAFAHQQAPAPASNGPTANQTANMAQRQAQAQAQHQTATGGAASAQGGAGGRGGSSSSRSSTGPVTVNNSTGGGGGYNARGNTPDVVGGSVSGGNSCGLGASGGGSGPGFGGLLSFMWEGKGCERRMNAALLANLGQTEAALETLCYDDTVRRALYSVGRPCDRDARGWAGY